MRDGRKRVTRLLAGMGVGALIASMAAAPPSAAQPRIPDVRARVQHLYRQAEVASERLNAAQENVSRGETRLRALGADVARKQKQVAQIRRQVVDAVVSQSQGQALSPATRAALAQSPDGFLQSLVMMAQYNDQQHQKQATFAAAARQLRLRQQAAARQLDRLTENRHELATQKATILAKARTAKHLLHRLKARAAARAAARVARAARSVHRPSPPPAPAPAPVSSAPGRAAAAVGYALAQLGDAYVWGASGPDAFDCSGLTMMAWRQAGVSLPHSSSAQMSYGTPVSRSQLRPGDLVFYYSPVSHVGIYIGNGKIVNAENPSVGVVEAPVDSMPYAGAVRPG